MEIKKQPEFDPGVSGICIKILPPPHPGTGFPGCSKHVLCYNMAAEFSIHFLLPVLQNVFLQDSVYKPNFGKIILFLSHLHRSEVNNSDLLNS